MHNSDTKINTSRKGIILRRIGVLAAAAAVLLGMEFVARICFDSVHFADYYKYDIKRIEAEDNPRVGMVISGASQVYHACDTNILAEKLGFDEVIAASSAGQVSDGSYFLVRDILDRFDPEYVVIGMSWDRFFPKKLGNLHGGRLLTADHLPNYLDQVEYFIKNAPVGQWFNLSYLYRFGGKVQNLEQLKTNYISKKQVASGEWNLDTEAPSYYGKNGYIICKSVGVDGQMMAEQLTFAEDRVSQHELEYMTRIADLCRKRGKKLIWMTIPSTLAEIYSIDNYQFAIDYATKFLEGTGYPYLNFNMLKDRETLFPDRVFSDHIHLGEEGSHTFSMLFADIIKRMEDGEDVSDMFYASEEEMKADVHRIVGSNLQVVRMNDGAVQAEITSLQNNDIVPQYRLEVYRGDTWVTISDWQENTSVRFSGEELAIGEQVRLLVRQKGKDEPEASRTAFVVDQAAAGPVEEVYDASE